jgi:hypothetical protein
MWRCTERCHQSIATRPDCTCITKTGHGSSLIAQVLVPPKILSNFSRSAWKALAWMTRLIRLLHSAGLLLNPRLFAGPKVLADRLTLAFEYVEYAEAVGTTPPRCMRDHLMVRALFQLCSSANTCFVCSKAVFSFLLSMHACMVSSTQNSELKALSRTRRPKRAFVPKNSSRVDQDVQIDVHLMCI